MKSHNSLSFSFMCPEDAEALSALAQRIWRAYYPALISVDQIEYMLKRNYTVEMLRQNLADGQKVMLARQEGVIKGFMGLGELATMKHPLQRGERTGEGCYYLHRCYLAPELHGKGAAQALFDATLKQMPQVTLIRLQVHRRNVRAQAFYKRQGFRVVLEHDFDLGTGFLMQDYVMQWEKSYSCHASESWHPA